MQHIRKFAVALNALLRLVCNHVFFAASLLRSKLSFCLPVVFSCIDAVLQSISEMSSSKRKERAIPDHGLQN